MTDQGKTTEKRDRARVLHGQNGKCEGMTGKGAADPRNGREKHCKALALIAWRSRANRKENER